MTMKTYAKALPTPASTLTLRNHSTGGTGVLETTVGGTQTITNASVVIEKLN